MIQSILCVVTAGAGGQDEMRARLLAGRLARDTGASLDFAFADRQQNRRAVAKTLAGLIEQKPDLIYLEGSGISAGWPLIQAAKKGQRFVVSSGDPIAGFFRTTRGQLAGAAFAAYERRLMRSCAAFIGWTPYLTGRAIEMGARRAITVEGGADLGVFQPPSPAQKLAARKQLGLPADHLVCVVVGSLNWSSRQSYAYGLELIETLKQLKRHDVSLLIVGDGTGRAQLEARVPAALKERAVFTGRLPQQQVLQALHAADIGFVTQTLDGLGSFRLTTKLPEYLAAGLAVAMSPIPGFYDYVWPAGWALPAAHPASAEFATACAAWLDGLSPAQVQEKAALAPAIARQRFDYEVLADRFSQFLRDALQHA